MKVDPAEIWRAAAARGPRTGQKVESGHPLDLALGVDEMGRPFLSVQLSGRPPQVPAVRGLDIAQRLRGDSQWLLLISLLELEAVEQFATLCTSLVDDSAMATSESGALSQLLESLSRWRRLFRPGVVGRLSDEELAGLAGEFWYMSTAIDSADLWPTLAASWKGPLGAVRDFELPDGRAVEVKTAHSSSRAVRISSADQLSSDSMQLVVVTLERCAPEDGTTLRELVERIEAALIPSPATRDRFVDLTETAGFTPRDRYDDVAFRFQTTHTYQVAAGFPRIVATELLAGVGGVSYEVSLAVIRPFLVEQLDHTVEGGSNGH